MFPSHIKQSIDQLSKLPEIGPRAATRLVFYLLNQDQKELVKFAELFRSLKKETKLCQQCFNITDSKNSLCSICRNRKRKKEYICVVENILDIIPIEKTKYYPGLYHVLGGLISPPEGIGPEKIRIKELLNRLKKDSIKEVILALNPTTEGDTTALYLEKNIIAIKKDVKVSRLGRGLSTGSDLEYIDEGTLSAALKGRR